MFLLLLFAAVGWTTLRTVPELDPWGLNEAGLHVRFEIRSNESEIIRNKTDDWTTRIRLIKDDIWCNESDDRPEKTLSETGDLYSISWWEANITNNSSSYEGVAIIAVPDFNFRICFINPNHTSTTSYIPFDNDPEESDFGTSYNVSRPSYSFLIQSSDSSASSYALLKIYSSYSGGLNETDIIKIVPKNSLCAGELHPLTGNIASSYYIDEAFTQYSEFGSYLRASDISTYDRVAGIFGIRLPGSWGEFSVCFSGADDRVLKDAPGWRFLPKKNMLWVTMNALIVTKKNYKLTWKIPSNDYSVLSFAVLKVNSTLPNLATSGDKLRLVHEFDSCFGRFSKNLQSVNYSGDNAAAFSNLMQDPYKSVVGSETGFTAVFAYLRLPEVGGYAICYQRKNQNWERIPQTLQTAINTLNLTININDTAVGSESVLSIAADYDALSTFPTPADSWFPSANAIAIKLVMVDGNCADSFYLHADFNLGDAEVFLPNRSTRASLIIPTYDSDLEYVSMAYSYIPIPLDLPPVRICVRHGDLNWMAAGILYPAPPHSFSIELNESRAGMFAVIHIEALGDSMIDNSLFNPESGTGSILRLVPNNTLCTFSYPVSEVYVDSVDVMLESFNSQSDKFSKGYLYLPSLPGFYSICLKVQNNNWTPVTVIQITSPPRYDIQMEDVPEGGQFHDKIFLIQNTPDNKISYTDLKVRLINSLSGCDEAVFGYQQRAVSFDMKLISSSTTELGFENILRFGIQIPPSRSVSHYKYCISDGENGWHVPKKILKIPPSSLTYISLGHLLSGFTVDLIMVSNTGDLSSWGSAKLVPESSYCNSDGESIKGTLLSSLNRVSAMRVRFRLPNLNVASQFRVCFKTSSWIEVSEGVFSSPVAEIISYSVDKGVWTPHLNFNKFVIIPTTTEISGGIQPLRHQSNINNDITHKILSGSESTFIISVSVSDRQLYNISLIDMVIGLRISKIEPTAQEPLYSVSCDLQSDTCQATIMVTPIPGRYSKQLQLATGQVCDVGGVDVVDNLISVSFSFSKNSVSVGNLGRLSLSDGSVNSDMETVGSLSPSDLLKIVPSTSSCSDQSVVSNIVFRCTNSSTTSCGGLVESTAVVDMTSLSEGSYRMCYYRRTGSGGRIPPGIYTTLLIESTMKYLVFGTPSSLSWGSGGSPVRFFNNSLLLEQNAELTANVELRWQSRKIAPVTTPIEVVISRASAQVTGGLLNYGSCSTNSSKSFATNQYNTIIYSYEGMASFNLRLLSDCNTGCDISFSAYSGTVVLTTKVFYTNTVIPTKISVDPNKIILNSDSPITSTSTEWYSVVVKAFDDLGNAAIDRQLSISILPNTTELGNATFRCRYSASFQSCGPASSPGPFSVVLSSNGSISFDVGLTGPSSLPQYILVNKPTIHNIGLLSIQLGIDSIPSTTTTVKLAVKNLNISSLYITDVGTAVFPDLEIITGFVRTPVPPWKAKTSFPSKKLFTLEGRFFLVGRQYTILCTAGDSNSNLVSHQDIINVVSGVPTVKLLLIDPRNGSVNGTVIASKTLGVSGSWSLSVVFNKPCGSYDVIDRIPCEIYIQLVNTTLSASLFIWIREPATHIAVTPKPFSPGSPFRGDILALGNSGFRDFWYTNPAYLSLGSSWGSDATINPLTENGNFSLAGSNPAKGFFIFGRVLLENLTTHQSCQNCPIDVISPGLRSAPVQLWSTTPDVAAIEIKREYPELNSRRVVNQWITYTVMATGVNGEETFSDDSWVWLHRVEGTVGDPEGFFSGNATTPLVDVLTDPQTGKKSRKMISSKVVFKIRYLLPCIDCNVVFRSRTGPSWISSFKQNYSAIEATSKPNTIFYSPSATELFIKVSGAVTSVDRYEDKGNNITAIHSVQNESFSIQVIAWDGLNKTMDVRSTTSVVSSSVRVNNIPNIILVSEGSSTKIPMVMMHQCNGLNICSVVLEAVGYQSHIVLFKVSEIPNKFKLHSNTSSLRPYAGSYKGDYWGTQNGFINQVGMISINLFENELPIGGAHGGVYVNVSHDVNHDLRQNLICISSLYTKCLQQSASSLHVINIYIMTGGDSFLIAGTRSDISAVLTVTVEDSDRNWVLKNSSLVVNWTSSYAPRRLVVRDSAPYAGDNWLKLDKQKGETDIGYMFESKLENFNYQIPNSLFVNQTFPIWLQLNDIHGNAVKNSVGKITTELYSRSGCGLPSVTTIGVKLFDVGNGNNGASPQQTVNYPAPITDGRALVWVTFKGSCEYCKLKFSYSGLHDISSSLRFAVTKEFTVRILHSDTLVMSMPDYRRVTDNIISLNKNVSIGLIASSVYCLQQQNLCYRDTTQSGQLQSHMLRYGSMHNSTIFVKTGTGVVSSSFPHTCPLTGCSVVISQSVNSPVGEITKVYQVPWTYDVKAVFSRYEIMGSTSVVFRTNDIFSITLAAVDLDGYVVTTHNNSTISLTKIEGGGNGDGGSLIWSNPPPPQKYITFDSSPLYSSQWSEGLLTWKLQFTTACSMCILLIGGIPVNVVVQAKSTQLVIEKMNTRNVLIREALLFRVVAIDNFRNWDESVGNPSNQVKVNITIIGYSGNVIRRDPNLLSRDLIWKETGGLVQGVMWIAVAFDKPIEEGELHVTTHDGQLSSRSISINPILRETPSSKTTITVRTSATNLRVISKDFEASVNGIVRVVIAATDVGILPNVDFDSPNLRISFKPLCDIPVIIHGGGDHVLLTKGKAVFPLSFLDVPTGGTCAIRFSAPQGTLVSVSTQAVFTVGMFVCSQLVMTSGKIESYNHILSNTWYPITVSCADDLLQLDSSIDFDNIILTPTGDCQFKLKDSLRMVNGVIQSVIRFDNPGEGCGLFLELFDKNITSIEIYNMTVQNPVELILEKNISQSYSDGVTVNSPVGLQLSVISTIGTLVKGVTESIEVSFEGDILNQIQFLSSLTPVNSSGQFGIWIQFQNKTTTNVRLLFKLPLLNLYCYSDFFVIKSKPHRLVIDNASTIKTLRLSGMFSTMTISVSLLDTEGYLFSSDQFVSCRLLNSTEFRPLQNQSSLHPATRSSSITKRLDGGRMVFNLVYVGDDADVFFAVVPHDGTLESTERLILTFQKIDYFIVESEAISKHPTERRPFTVTVSARDALGNIALGDNFTTFSATWISNEFTQRVVFMNQTGKFNKGKATIKAVYNSKSVNTSVGFNLYRDGYGVLTIWSFAFSVKDEISQNAINLPEPYIFPWDPPIVVVSCGLCDFGTYSEVDFRNNMEIVFPEVEVKLTGKCDINGTTCVFYNKTTVGSRSVSLLENSGSVLEFSFQSLTELETWDAISFIIEAFTEGLQNNTSPVALIFKPLFPVVVIIQPDVTQMNTPIPTDSEMSTITLSVEQSLASSDSCVLMFDAVVLIVLLFIVIV